MHKRPPSHWASALLGKYSRREYIQSCYCRGRDTASLRRPHLSWYVTSESGDARDDAVKSRRASPAGDTSEDKETLLTSLRLDVRRVPVAERPDFPALGLRERAPVVQELPGGLEAIGGRAADPSDGGDGLERGRGGPGAGPGGGRGRGRGRGVARRAVRLELCDDVDAARGAVRLRDRP